jgi:hypothetical protein
MRCLSLCTLLAVLTLAPLSRPSVAAPPLPPADFVLPQSATKPEPFPEHTIIDFSDLPNAQIEKKAKKLRGYAQARGYLYISETIT